MKGKKSGKLVIIGGREDKDGDREILSKIAEEVGSKTLVVTTVASKEPEALAKGYKDVFHDLGIKHIEVLDVRERQPEIDAQTRKMLKEAGAIFFTGGDQLRITSQIADTPIYQEMQAVLDRGGLIAGTSAGAAAMPKTMIVAGGSDETNSLDDIRMAPGLGLVDGVIIDSHFAERGRMGRLLVAVVQNPAMVGLGIDEDTAIVFENGRTSFRVVGSGAVYVVDGAKISYSSLSEEKLEEVVSIHDVILHVLGAGGGYDLKERSPLHLSG